MRKFLLTGFVLISLACFAANYGIYHDSTPGRNTAILISNLSDEDAYFRTIVYDSEGKDLWKDTYKSKPYETVLIDLSQKIPQSDKSWGLILIQCDQLLYISALYSDGEMLFTRNHVIEPVQVSSDAKYYWYGVNYTNFGNAETAFALLNTSNKSSDLYLWVYDYTGSVIKELSGSIAPKGAAYVDLAKEVSAQTSGVVDIRSTQPIVIGVEYYQSGQIWIIENIVDWYTTTSW
ncbi:MAG TPA: hypothetical protein PLP64_05120 [Pseudothermotoga sp.]|nr:hypothetical protein [Pseudothermotoga sp.]HOK83590.1 hypothetical protein [Pseudothermotoga sp.]HPP71007.1 hypothetical protein [Pseudothermotoga sp.]